MAEMLGVAEAKRRFSELIERVKKGERFLVSRRGRPAVALVPPDQVQETDDSRPVGLAAVAGALSEWEGLDEAVSEIYEARRRARDRAAPDLA